MSLSASLTNVPSLHPTIQISIPASHLTLPAHCRPFLLQRLPPAVFLDKYAYRLDNRALVHPSTVKNITYLGLTELERAVGWSDPEGKTRSADRFVRKLHRHRKRLEDAKARGQPAPPPPTADSDEGEDTETAEQDLEASKRALSLEHSAVLIELQRRATHEDPQLAEKVVKAIKGEDVDLSAEGVARNQKRETVLSIPVHARYLPPLPAGQAGTRASWSGLDINALVQQVVDPKGPNGLYENVHIDRPEVFWACEGEMTQEEAFKQGWTFVEPHNLLPQPEYSHVSFTPPFPPFNPHYLRFLRPNPSTNAADLAPLTLRVPRGDASLGPILQSLTYLLIGLAAWMVLLQTRKVTAQVRRVERGRTA
ncbi:hypothetical protein OC846_001945 [Tilletia horrida]|uniref:Protein PBN1 n=1 Tax=Tilletia horrida TaxID=155126 RepID=A0AAN6GST5_9BASI|nr:hypothetical protein OC846_001945 [Tilletia horrida]